MAIINGCQEGKATPKLLEVKCPKCGELLEIFVRMGGGAKETGRLTEDVKCEACGYVAEEGALASEFQPYDD